MKTNWLYCLMLVAGACFGQVLYQELTGRHNWQEAFERSYFVAVGVVCSHASYWLASMLRKAQEGN